MIVGLTGGMGSGKSTVAAFFRELGVPVYDSDEEAKLLMVDSEEVRKDIVQLFGPGAYHGKKLNKAFISKIVFNEKEKLKQLNAVVHPAVRKHFLSWVQSRDFPYVIQETALIFENKAQKNYDLVILVTAPEKVRIQRVMDRDAMSEAQIKARLGNQLSDESKIPLADHMIENIDLEQTKKDVGKLHKTILTKALKKS
ncbi:dephospho-CoA kinase [Muricauda sp. SCSIO 64092]|uniref:dephospho-CoA kinase n=1 Tax=Allomuricauda sp. SCSIO 64092 TaxID=2908842 RepID=UPI001FF30AF8|nr:dephospho-CoA kinase [Muricauda sp. SCSIO 64092]UOY06923.1 dephospho-CoA kinase [Muricauda sp. SCSIO 64092]